jgi:prepilin-type N-terminal cleavage/methylation domain-containing protein
MIERMGKSGNTGVRHLRQVVADVRGMTLIEVLIAVAILGLVAVAFLPALAIFYDRTALSAERTTSEQLAKSQMEYVMSQDYTTEGYQKLPDASGCHIELSAVPAHGGGTDDGIQKVTGSDSLGKLLFTLQGYKLAQ